MRREYVVTANACLLSPEEARRKVLRDLHDGVGPSLAAVALGLRAARGLVHHDPAAASRLLCLLEEETHTAIRELRQLSASTHPSALMRFGLPGAVRHYANALANSSATNSGTACREIDVMVDGDLPALPTAVEVAAYRIACEALANVATHSEARHCSVRIWFDSDLHVEVTDDGVGWKHPNRCGTGLASMRERADEVGGRWTIGRSASGGTRVAVHLPLPRRM